MQSQRQGWRPVATRAGRLPDRTDSLADGRPGIVSKICEGVRGTLGTHTTSCTIR